MQRLTAFVLVLVRRAPVHFFEICTPRVGVENHVEVACLPRALNTILPRPRSFAVVL